MKEISQFIEDLKSLCNKHSKNKIKLTNCVFKMFDDQLSDCKFEFIKTVLDQLKADEFPVQVLVYILSVTYPCMGKLSPSRDSFYLRVSYFAVLKLGRDKAERLLQYFL